MSFTEKLGIGLAGESQISKWLIGRGWNVLPAYEVEQQHGKGPRLFTASGPIVSPDLLCFNGHQVFWIEAKTKSAFTWHRGSRTWQTGIDLRHWKEYQRIEATCPWPVWLMFLHKSGSNAKDTPHGMVSPCGLFGNTLSFLMHHVHHEHPNHGPSGMVYWAIDSLKFIAPATTFSQTDKQVRSPETSAGSRPVCPGAGSGFPLKPDTAGLRSCNSLNRPGTPCVTRQAPIGSQIPYNQPRDRVIPIGATDACRRLSVEEQRLTSGHDRS